MNHAIDKLMVPLEKKVRLGDIDPGDTRGLTKEDAAAALVDCPGHFVTAVGIRRLTSV